jgi:hypothetical protein
VVWNQVAGPAGLLAGVEDQPLGLQGRLAVPKWVVENPGVSANASPRSRGMPSSSMHNLACSQATHGERMPAAAMVPLEMQGTHMTARDVDGDDGGGVRAESPRTGSVARLVSSGP